jgi:hypothetical protein
MSAYVWTWIAICGAALLAWLTKLAGHVVPERVVENPRVHRIAAYVTVALLAALAAVQAFTTRGELVLDARLAAMAVAVVALVARAPFIVVVALAAATAAGLRWLGVG